MRIVKRETVCEVCDALFYGEFIEHERPEDDFDWERDPAYQRMLIEEEGFDEEDVLNPVYPHEHEQPTVECHICPKCREVGEKR